MVNGHYKFALVLTDVQSRYVTAFELFTLSAKSVVDKIICLQLVLRFTSIYFVSLWTSLHIELTKVCLERLGVSSRFHTPHKIRDWGLSPQIF
jgi:hypothetical protein